MPATPYHHGHLREALLEAAVLAVRESGPEGLALRDLARRVGVSHNAAYHHFADRDELVAEVAAVVMQRLVDTMESHLATVRTRDRVLRARRRLAETGRGYVDFALAETGLFRLAFMSSAAVAAVPGVERGPYVLLGQVLDELVDVGFLAPAARPGAEVACWSSMHGFSVLHVEGPLRDASEGERDAALEQVLGTIDRSFAATTGATVDPRDLRVPG